MTTLESGNGEFDRSIKTTRIEAQFHQTLFATLPDHLIFDHILSRLPVKPLTRFKVVSKFWLSIISSFEFAQTHLKFSSLRPKFIAVRQDLFSAERHKFFLLSYEENNNVNDLIGLNLNSGYNWVFVKLDIVGSCNGLVCLHLHGIENASFCLWNPVTKQCRRIKIPDGEDFACGYGFGYASAVDDYKIVALCLRTKGRGSFYVFSVRTDQWERIDDSVGFHISFLIDNRAVVFNDTLYWTLKYPNDRQNNLKDWQKAKCIVGFDLVNGKLKEIPWMDWFFEYNEAYFFKMEGRLSLLCHGDEGSDVWVQKQYDDWNSWEKLFSVNLGGMSFLKFTETGKCLVNSSDQLKVIDPSKDSIEESQMGAHFSGRITSACAYVESFISPFDPFSKARPLEKEIRIE